MTVVRTPIGRTSGDGAPAHADHTYQVNTATSVSWLNEQVPSSGALRPGSGRAEPRRGAALAPDAARGPRWASADGAECARSPPPLRSARSAGSAHHIQGNALRKVSDFKRQRSRKLSFKRGFQ